MPHSSNRFSGKVALLTGAASGIGRATAVRLAQEGAKLSLADIDSEGLEQTRKLLEEYGTEVQCIEFDACDEQACSELPGQTVDQFGQIDILGNIAGIVSFWHLHEITSEIWHRSMQINLTAPMLISREAMPHLLKSQGNIVNISSTAGIGGQAYNTVYSATKHGVIGLTKSLAVEFASRNVRVNAICPGGVKTALNDKLRWADNMDQKLVQRLMPLIDHIADPAEIASLFAQLASDESRFVTGAAWVIDGGQTCG